ncbi:MAG: type II secretion system protein GspM, partial [Acidiferrobacterales bacterium]
MVDRLTPMQKRLFALALLALVLALACIAVIPPVLAQYRAYEEKISELTYRLRQYDALAQDQAVNSKLLDQVKRRGVGRRYYLANRKAARASAELQQRIKRVVASSSGQLVSTQVVGEQGS